MRWCPPRQGCSSMLRGLPPRWTQRLGSGVLPWPKPLHPALSRDHGPVWRSLSRAGRRTCPTNQRLRMRPSASVRPKAPMRPRVGPPRWPSRCPSHWMTWPLRQKARPRSRGRSARRPKPTLQRLPIPPSLIPPSLIPLALIPPTLVPPRLIPRVLDPPPGFRVVPRCRPRLWRRPLLLALPARSRLHGGHRPCRPAR